MPVARHTSLGLSHAVASPGQFGPPPSALGRLPNAPDLNVDHLNNVGGSRVRSQLPSVTDFGGARSTGHFPSSPATMSSAGAATFVGCKPDRRRAPPSPASRRLSPRLVPIPRASTNLGSIIRRAENGRPKVHGPWCNTKHALSRIGRKLKGIFHFGTQTPSFVVHSVSTTAAQAVRPLFPFLRSSTRSSMRSRRGHATRMTTPAAMRTSDMTDNQPSVVETSPGGTRINVYQSNDTDVSRLTDGQRLTMYQGEWIVTAATTDAGTALDALEGRTAQTTAGAEDNERTSTGLSIVRDEPETLSTPQHSKQPNTRADSKMAETPAAETFEPTPETRTLNGVLPSHIQPTQTFEALLSFLPTLPVKQLNNKQLIESLVSAPAYKSDAGCQWLCAKIIADIDETTEQSPPIRPDTKRASTLPPDLLPFIASVPPMSPFPETSAWDRSSIAGTGTLYKVRKQLAAQTADEMNAVPSPLPASLRPGSQMFPQPARRPASRAAAAAGGLPYPATPAAAQPAPRPTRPNPAPRLHTYAEPSSVLGYIAYGGSFELHGPATPVRAGAAQPSRPSSTNSFGAYLREATRAEHRKTVNKIESVMLTPVVAQMPGPANPQPTSGYPVAMPTPSAFGGGFRDSSSASAGASAPPPVPAPIAPSSQQPNGERHSVPRKAVPSTSRSQPLAQPVSAPSRGPTNDKSLPAPPPPGHPDRFSAQVSHPLRMNQAHVYMERKPQHRGKHHRQQTPQNRGGEAQQRQQAADEAPQAKPSKRAMVKAAFKGLLEVNHEFGQKRR